MEVPGLAVIHREFNFAPCSLFLCPLLLAPLASVPQCLGFLALTDFEGQKSSPPHVMVTLALQLLIPSTAIARPCVMGGQAVAASPLHLAFLS